MNMSEDDSPSKDISKKEDEESTTFLKDDKLNKNKENGEPSEKEETKESEQNEKDEPREKKENGHPNKDDEPLNDVSNADRSLELKLDSTKESKDEEDHDESMEEEESMEESREETELPANMKEKKSVEVKGKRDRKKVERYVQETKKEEVEITGAGVPLGDIPYIEKMITKFSPEDLKTLHRLAYNRPGTAVEIRKNLKKFKGFSFKPEDITYERKKHAIEKVVMAELKKIAIVLGLERKGVKNDVAERVFNFLMNPQDLGKAVPGSKRKSKGKGKGQKRQKKSKEKSNKKNSTKSSKEGEEEESAEDEEDEDDEENNVEEEEEEESEEEVVEEVKPKKQRKTPAKKVAIPKTKNATPAAGKKAAKKRPKTDSTDSSEESEREPLAKKVKKAPTDAEITAFIKKTLEKANLEEVTMKKLCQQVYDNYPKHDLSHKKDFIKSTVKSILS